MIFNKRPLPRTGPWPITPDSEFATGQLVSIGLHTRTAIIINAGHVCPLRLRAGRVESVKLPADPPFGTVRDYRYRVHPCR